MIHSNLKENYIDYSDFYLDYSDFLKRCNRRNQFFKISVITISFI